MALSFTEAAVLLILLRRPGITTRVPRIKKTRSARGQFLLYRTGLPIQIAATGTNLSST
jgi:hypothetical protein